MRRSRGMSTLIDLENAAPDVLFHTAPGTDEPIWPLVRMSVAQAMAAVELGSEAVSETARTSIPSLAWRYAKAFMPARELPPRRRSRGVAFVVGGTTVRVHGEYLENWLVDPLARVAQNGVVFQSRPLNGRPEYPFTYSLDASFARLDVKNRLRPTRKRPVEAVRTVLTEIAPSLEISIEPSILDEIAHQASYALSRVDRVNRVFGNLLDRVQPELVVMEDASYGSSAPVIRMMKSQGVRVVEPQHGWIGQSHGAYNFGRAMRSPELFATLPDELLTFGDFWSSSIEHPSRVVAIGKPHMDTMRQDLVPFGERSRTVLIASSVSQPDAMSSFVIAVRDALPPDWTIVFRTHPTERSTQHERYPRLVAADRIDFDSQTDVYESLKTCRAVIGVASTVLYEALAMGCHVFVRDSPYADFYIDDVFGETLRDASSLERLAQTLAHDAPPSLGEVQLDRFWKRNAVGNFSEYLAGFAHAGRATVANKPGW